jgi:hypothetical protein
MRIPRRLRGDAGANDGEVRGLDEEDAADGKAQLAQRERSGLDRFQRERDRNRQ